MHHHHYHNHQHQQQQIQHQHHHQHHHRRRKKRPNYGTRTIEVSRGYAGFGFTISGQQPCILSCIVPNSPADQAGLRAGDFLISVNGLNVSKLPHEAVVQLIGNSLGTIRMQIAENFFSDSSDEENIVNLVNRVKPRYLHHKTKMNRIRNSPQKSIITRENCKASRVIDDQSSIIAQQLHPVIEDVPLPTAHSIIHSPNASTSKDIKNVSAMVRKLIEPDNQEATSSTTSAALEYRAIVGYLGTIEMPKQIATSSKLQTVRSCIRKMRQEKRNPTTVLMTILPNCLTLRNSNATVLATYPSSRLNYVSSSSDNESRFFGLVTSAIFASGDDDPVPLDSIARGILQDPTREIIISNSCHIFAVDAKLCDHNIHEQKAIEFKIKCTKDPISNLCLEFPNNSEYVVNLIRSMYTMKIMPPPIRQHYNLFNLHQNSGSHNDGQQQQQQQHMDPSLQANSPQPSNHSEVTTTSSNSDSGIGFHNDCTNISDRILVVDFPAMMMNRVNNGNSNLVLPRPQGICNVVDRNSVPQSLPKLKPLDFNTRLTVRAMPDPKSPTLITKSRIPDLLTNFNNFNSNSNGFLTTSTLSATRSCDDVIASVERDDYITKDKQLQMSMDDLRKTTVAAIQQYKSNDDHVFIQPMKPLRKPRRNSSSHSRNTDATAVTTTATADSSETETNNKPLPSTVSLSSTPSKTHLSSPLSYKLSPKVFGLPSRLSSAISFENLFHSQNRKSKKLANKSRDAELSRKLSSSSSSSLDIWGSLQDLHKSGALDKCNNKFLEGTYSEPDLMSRALPSSTSPFKRWGQSSFRTSKQATEQISPLSRRPSSLAASETDVYTKSMEDFMDDLNSHHNYGGGGGDNMQDYMKSNNSHTHYHQNYRNQQQYNSNSSDLNAATNGSNSKEGINVTNWGTSFEKLLEDSTGLHTFAEFLKKEFSAENIYFWTACERYRQIESQTERAVLAQQIFLKHLATRASEPVNVDSQARNISEENLKLAEKNLFVPAQKQIFNLMKFDSYQRFIRSELYKKCLDAEAKHQALPYPGEQLDELLRTTINSPGPSTKLKKSASNAEDRRRKSLLPWHRKTRCKSRDRNECDIMQQNLSKSNGKSSVGNSLKIPNANSTSDIHSSRSSLSSFDATIAAAVAANSANGGSASGCGGGTGSGSDDSKTLVYSLCRVILCDGATTIVQTRPNETIKQLIDRLLEKRGIHYQFYDVLLNGQSKSLDLENPATMLAGKEVQIEHRVAFKLDLPDPKVISVKSKPKKALFEVLRPILHKYNYRLEDVRVLIKETHDELDMSLQVTEIDGQRLQVVLLKSEELVLQQKPRSSYSTSSTTNQQQPQQFYKNIASFPSSKPTNKAGNQQSTLDEITNKVFNELLQGKVESHGSQIAAPKQLDRASLKSDDCASETSSIFERFRRRDSSGIPGFKISRPKKQIQPNSKSSVGSEDGLSNGTQITGGSDPTNNSGGCTKKPLIAKWKAGVKLQVPGRTENHEEFLEGLKRAQRARLEDQRGTEINSELPDFLKDKEKFSAASKLRKTRANLNPSGGPNTSGMSLINNGIGGNLSSATGNTVVANIRNNFEMNSNLPLSERPQPAPRLSIVKANQSLNSTNSSISPMKIDSIPSEINENLVNSTDDSKMNNSYNDSSNHNATLLNNSSGNNELEMDYSTKGPPPLPPKPKILPIKPSNWGQNCGNGSLSPNGNVNPLLPSPVSSSSSSSSKIPVMIDNLNRRHLALEQNNNINVYLDQPSSSFV